MNLQARIHTSTETMSLPKVESTPARVRWLAAALLVAIVAAGAVVLAQLRSADDIVPKTGAEQTKVEPLLSPEEKAFIDRVRRGPIASVAGRVALRPSRFVPLVIPEEQAFIAGKYSGSASIEWCLHHSPC